MSNPNFLSVFLTGDVLHPSNLFTPSYAEDAELWVWYVQRKVEGQNHFPCLADHTAWDADQDTVGFLGCRHTFLGHV